MDEFQFQERIEREAEARRIARKILGAKEGASRQDLKRAWREACKRHHPDHNPGDSKANRTLAAIHCAYRLLAHGEPCRMLLEDQRGTHTHAEQGDYDLGTAWGYFLWWRDEYFA